MGRQERMEKKKKIKNLILKYCMILHEELNVGIQMLCGSLQTIIEIYFQ